MSDENTDMTLAVITYILAETQTSLLLAKKSIARAENAWSGLDSLIAKSMTSALDGVKKDITAIEFRLAKFERELQDMKEGKRREVESKSQ